MENRLNYLDVVCGICILHIVLSHIAQNVGLDNKLGGVLHVVFWSMAWFFFKGGMFHKDRSFPVSIKKNFHRLIVPFLIFSALGEIEYVICALLEHNPVGIYDISICTFKDLISKGYVIGNPPLWFLLTLFVIKTGYSFLGIIGNLKRSLIILLFSLLFSVLLYNITVPLYWIKNIPMGLFFYVAGHLLREKQYSRYVASLSAVILIVIALFFDSEVSIVMLKLNYGNFYIWIIYALAAVIVANNAFKWLGKYCSLKSIGRLGENSMIIYVSHWPIFMISHCILSMSGLQNPTVLFLLMSTVVLIIVYLEYKLIQKYNLGYVIGL